LGTTREGDERSNLHNYSKGGHPPLKGTLGDLIREAISIITCKAGVTPLKIIGRSVPRLLIEYKNPGVKGALNLAED